MTTSFNQSSFFQTPELSGLENDIYGYSKFGNDSSLSSNDLFGHHFLENNKKTLFDELEEPFMGT